ncbi:uncharacterized protein B0H64DRAFT_446570 [Chaetomium fimeti]|uniref:Complex 1 LYR protein domain-containing protein n=1 Tax=Chaetomium fimeti TaxID=1854472 RepID=A0AAE0H7K6_9PEZI|nr:hypothetical protein B0H64DRAFT_446570 [Chaetomium fimeti]
MPSLFVPARSSRHRIACFALYRSLLRQGLRVPLPDELSTASPLGPANPIQTLIRNAFHRNKRDTSPRLVVSALKNGYRYLTLLSRAADATSPEHASALTFLRENQARVVDVKAKAADAAAKRISTAPIADRTPLLKRVSADGEPPVYEPAAPPRPLEAFKTGVRKPPTLAAASGVPFLRFWKPQPRFLERVVRQKSQRRAKRIARILEMQGGEEMDSVVEEDQWEMLVAKMLAEEKGVKSGDAGPTREATYKQTLCDAVSYLADIAEKERVDLMARGEAMWKIVLTEQEMALQEEKDRLAREGMEGEEPQLRVWKRPVHKRVPRVDPTDKNEGVEKLKLSIRRVRVGKASPGPGSSEGARKQTGPTRQSTETGASTDTGPSTGVD